MTVGNIECAGDCCHSNRQYALECFHSNKYYCSMCIGKCTSVYKIVYFTRITHFGLPKMDVQNLNGLEFANFINLDITKFQAMWTHFVN